MFEQCIYFTGITCKYFFTKIFNKIDEEEHNECTEACKERWPDTEYGRCMNENNECDCHFPDVFDPEEAKEGKHWIIGK